LFIFPDYVRTPDFVGGLRNDNEVTKATAEDLDELLVAG
jgi:hypothetical protein